MSLAIAIDAMGGDHAPREIVRGAVGAAKVHPDLRLILVGREEAIRHELNEIGSAEPNVEIVHAEHVISMSDGPVEALRRKKGSSIEVATRLVRAGDAVAMVSAGNTGACVAAGTILLGLLPEVRRAGIAVCLPSGSTSVVVIDVGANISSKPEHLLQYGVMASLYAHAILGVDNPRVGLLNIGEEHEKGTSLVKTTHTLFRGTPSLNFVGNVEGVEIFRKVCDVIVCDGFVGNIVLKVSEGLAEQLVEQFRLGVEQALRTLPVRARSVVEVGAGGSGLVGGGGGNGDDSIGSSSIGSSSIGSSSIGSSGIGSSGKRLPSDAGGEADFAANLGKNLRGAFSAVRERIDYAEYGGAPLLGVNGVMIIAHGRSDARAISNAVRVAKRMVETDLNQRINEEIHALRDPR